MVDTQAATGSRPPGRRGGSGGGSGGRRGSGRGGASGGRPPLRLVAGDHRSAGADGHEPTGAGDGRGGPGARPALQLVAEGCEPAGAGGGRGSGGGGRGSRGHGSRRRGRSRPGAHPPLRLTRRGRIVIVVLAALGICTAFSVGRVTSSASTPPALPAAHMRVHVVTPGETLWGIARGLSPESDTRALVRWLSERNGLATAELAPGQVLLLP